MWTNEICSEELASNLKQLVLNQPWRFNNDSHFNEYHNIGITLWSTTFGNLLVKLTILSSPISTRCLPGVNSHFNCINLNVWNYLPAMAYFLQIWSLEVLQMSQIRELFYFYVWQPDKQLNLLPSLQILATILHKMGKGACEKNLKNMNWD